MPRRQAEGAAQRGDRASRLDAAILRRAILGCLMLLSAPLTGCDADTDPRRPIDGGRLDAGAFDAGPDARRDDTPCDRPELWAQCPVGSSPQVLARGCVEGAEIINDDGSTSGICARAGECLFACNFQDPCPCGIDRITNDGIFCTDCRDAAACGDAVCDGGEDPQTCPVDCGETCLAENERCDGNARQECEDNGRWATLACRADQICQFASADQKVVTVCQTRISMGGGRFPGFGQQARPVLEDSLGVRFRDTSFDGIGVRFVEDGARVLTVQDDRFVIVDPAGVEPDQPTNIISGRDIVASPARIARAGRWPQLSEFFDDTSRTVEAMVHDGAQATHAAVALSEDDQWLAAAFAVGLPGVQPEPVIGIWRASDGRLDHLLRFVDDAVVQGAAPATAVALGIDGKAAVEARANGVLIVWNVEESRFSHLIQSDVGTVTHLVPSVAGDDLLLVGGERGVELWAIEPEGGGDPQRRWIERTSRVQSLALAPDSSAVAVGTVERVLLLDARDASERFRIAATPRFLDFAPAGGRLMVGDAIFATSL